ncbi:MAG: MFS transporter [Anaerolineaceae bacterium]|nr:MFS transporter [Anaerolineaceae bacterium]
MLVTAPSRITLPVGALQNLSPDGRLLFITRIARLFAYGFLSVVLVLYLTQAGLSEIQAGLLLTLTLVGDSVITLWITTHADRIGRRKMLLAGAALMIFAGALFVLTNNFYLLLFAATVGVISPSGNEVGPFLSIEQAAISQLIPGQQRTGVFAWYNLVGSFATALGAAAGGGLAQALQGAGFSALYSYQAVVMGYALVGLVLLILFTRLTPEIEITSLRQAKPNPTSAGEQRTFWGLGESRSIVLRLALLFSLDAFAGGFVIQSLVAYWFHLRFGVQPGIIGAIFLGANILAGISALSAAWVAARIGLIRTMVFTHVPSNILLMLVPFMPTLPLAILVLLLRFSISQMDVPTRQSYVMAVVSPQERSAASGVTSIARTVGASLSPVLTSLFLANPALLATPFLVSGGLKLVYDLIMYRSFQAVRPPEEG